jgi:lipid-A-disaccharide synthase
MIGIDSPDFNLGLEKSIRAQGVKTVQYVCPSVWAWREGRIKDIKQSADLLLTLFPFESAFLQNKKVEAVHVGHPLADKLICSTETRAARKALKIDVDGEWVGLLPGSRYGEVSRLLPPFLESASRLLSSRKACRFIIPAASPSLEKFIRSESESVGLSHVVHVVAGRSQTCMEASDLLLMASGTATLEAVLIGRPMVVCYRLSALTYQILKRMIRVPFFSLPNLLSGRKVVPEMIQRQVTGERVAAVLERYLNDSALCREQLSCFESIRTELALGADQRAASAIASLLHEQAE